MYSWVLRSDVRSAMIPCIYWPCDRGGRVKTKLQLCCPGSSCGNVAKSLLELQVWWTCRIPSVQKKIAGGSPKSPYRKGYLGRLASLVDPSVNLEETWQFLSRTAPSKQNPAVKSLKCVSE